MSVGFSILNSISICRSLDEGWMGELGPMRIPTSQEFTRALIRRFNLVTSKFQARKRRDMAEIRNKKCSNKQK